jgi:TRAP-type C4-dicarboxylate transport system permease small subunit
MKSSYGPVGFLSKLMHGTGSVALVLMMLFTVTDVALRFMGKPIMGSNDIIGVIGLLVIAFGVPQTTLIGGHIYVDTVVEKMGRRTKRNAGITTRLLSICLFVLLFSGGAMKAWEFQSKGEVSQTLHIPLCWVIYAFAFCAFIQSAVLVMELIKLIKEETLYE